MKKAIAAKTELTIMEEEDEESGRPPVEDGEFVGTSVGVWVGSTSGTKQITLINNTYNYFI